MSYYHWIKDLSDRVVKIEENIRNIEYKINKIENFIWSKDAKKRIEGSMK